MHCATNSLANLYAPSIELHRAQMVHRNGEFFMTVGRGSPAVMVRMPEELKVWLKHRAIDNRRTLNSEVLVLLEQAKASQESTTQQTLPATEGVNE